MGAFIEKVTAMFRDGADTWPPPEVRKRWETVQNYRLRYENNRDQLAKADLNVSQDPHKMEIFTPVPWPRELCRFSAALLFSETPRMTLSGHEAALGPVVEVNDFGAFCVEAAVKTACEGRVGIRVIKDAQVSRRAPLLTVVSDDQILWDIRHGRFHVGGIVVITKEVDGLTRNSNKVYFRLFEEHQPGEVTRWVFKGDARQLGRRVSLSAVAEWAHLPEQEHTGLSSSTLIPWQNIPGGESDLFGLGPVFRAVNEAESLLIDRGRKSIPRLFVDRSLSDESGLAKIDGVIPVGGTRMRPTLGTGPMELVKLVQENFLSADHIAWIDHITQLMVTCAGYSPLTWGIQGKTANVTRAVSGYAMKLAQLRTLLTRSPKEHMALQALGRSIATAVCWSEGGFEVEDFLPTIELGDGLPPDPLDGAQEVAYLRQAVAASTETLVKTVHPTWTPEEVEAEAEAIMAEAASGVAQAQGLGPSAGITGSLADILRAARSGEDDRAGAGEDPAPDLDE